MQQRLGLAAALLGDPALVILDEPTSALDPVGRDDVRAIIREARDRGSTVFLNSHLLGEVERLCDRVAIVNHGRVIAAGTLGELLGEDGRPDPGDQPATGRRAGLAAFGTVAHDDEWLTIRPIVPTASPMPWRPSSGSAGGSTPSTRAGAASRTCSWAGPRER